MYFKADSDWQFYVFDYSVVVVVPGCLHSDQPASVLFKVWTSTLCIYLSPVIVFLFFIFIILASYSIIVTIIQKGTLVARN